MTDFEMTVDDGGGRQRVKKVNYPPNSRKSKEEARAAREQIPEKKVEKVVVGKVVQRKKGLASRLGGTFFSEDREGVMQFVVMEVLLPAAKNMISDAVSQGLERLLFGELRARSRNDRPGGYISYNKVRRPAIPEYGTIGSRARAQHDFQDIIFETRGEAEDVLDGLRSLIGQYELATVADLYTMSDITPDYTDDKWGWEDLSTAMVRHVRGGYVIQFPRARSIE